MRSNAAPSRGTTPGTGARTYDWVSSSSMVTVRRGSSPVWLPALMEISPPSALIASTTVSSSASGSWLVCSGMVPLTVRVTALPVVFAGKLSVAVPGFRLMSAGSLVAPSDPSSGSAATVTVTAVAVAVPAATLALRVTVIVALAPSVTRGTTSTFRPLPSNVPSAVSCAAASPRPSAKTTASSAAHRWADRGPPLRMAPLHLGIAVLSVVNPAFAAANPYRPSPIPAPVTAGAPQTNETPATTGGRTPPPSGLRRAPLRQTKPPRPPGVPGKRGQAGNETPPSPPGRRGRGGGESRNARPTNVTASGSGGSRRRPGRPPAGAGR